MLHTSTIVDPKALAVSQRHKVSSTSSEVLHSSTIRSNSGLSSYCGSIRSNHVHVSDAAGVLTPESRRKLLSIPTAAPTAAVVCQRGDEDKDADLSCNFDDFADNDGYCRFQNPNQAEGALTFARGSGETSTPLTGPSGDSSAPGDGYYMYSEATGVGTEVKLELRVNHTFCSQGVTFWYHMYGSGIGTLALSVSRVGTDYTSVWSKTGLQSLGSNAPWQFASVQTRSMTLAPIYYFKFTHTPDSDAGDVAIDDFAIIALPSALPTPVPSSPTSIPTPAPYGQPTHLPTPIPTLTLIPTPAPSLISTPVPTPSPTVFISIFTILSTRDAVIGAATFVAIILFALTLAAVRRGACASKRDFDDLEAEKSRREKERAIEKKKSGKIVDKQRAKEKIEQVEDLAFYRAQALEARHNKHAARKAARKAGNSQFNSPAAQTRRTITGRINSGDDDGDHDDDDGGDDDDGDDVDDNRNTSRGRAIVQRASKGLSKGLNEAGKAARSMAERSFSLGRSTSRGRTENTLDDVGIPANETSNQQSKSKPLTEHLHQKPIHKRSDLIELKKFLASGALEKLAPQFASAGLLKKKQLLALNHVSQALNSVGLKDSDRRRFLEFVAAARLEENRQVEDTFTIDALGFTLSLAPTPPPKSKIRPISSVSSRGRVSSRDSFDESLTDHNLPSVHTPIQLRKIAEQERRVQRQRLGTVASEARTQDRRNIPPLPPPSSASAPRFDPLSFHQNLLAQQQLNSPQKQQQQQQSNYGDRSRGNEFLSKGGTSLDFTRNKSQLQSTKDGVDSRGKEALSKGDGSLGFSGKLRQGGAHTTNSVSRSKGNASLGFSGQLGQGGAHTPNSLSRCMGTPKVVLSSQPSKPVRVSTEILGVGFVGEGLEPTRGPPKSASQGFLRNIDSSIGDTSTSALKGFGVPLRGAPPPPAPLPSRLADRMKEQVKRTGEQENKLEQARHSMDRSKPANPHSPTIGTSVGPTSSSSRTHVVHEPNFKPASVPTSKVQEKRGQEGRTPKAVETPRSMMDDFSGILGF